MNGSSNCESPDAWRELPSSKKIRLSGYSKELGALRTSELSCLTQLYTHYPFIVALWMSTWRCSLYRWHTSTMYSFPNPNLDVVFNRQGKEPRWFGDTTTTTKEALKLINLGRLLRAHATEGGVGSVFDHATLLVLALQQQQFDAMSAVLKNIPGFQDAATGFGANGLPLVRLSAGLACHGLPGLKLLLQHGAKVGGDDVFPVLTCVANNSTTDLLTFVLHKDRNRADWREAVGSQHLATCALAAPVECRLKTLVILLNVIPRPLLGDTLREDTTPSTSVYGKWKTPRSAIELSLRNARGIRDGKVNARLAAVVPNATAEYCQRVNNQVLCLLLDAALQGRCTPEQAVAMLVEGDQKKEQQNEEEEEASKSDAAKEGDPDVRLAGLLGLESTSSASVDICNVDFDIASGDKWEPVVDALGISMLQRPTSNE